jgi:hypothetical protein
MCEKTLSSKHTSRLTQRLQRARVQIHSAVCVAFTQRGVPTLAQRVRVRRLCLSCLELSLEGTQPLLRKSRRATSMPL